MKIFNEETSKGSGECVIILNREEAQRLCDMAEAAKKSNLRKKTWAKMSSDFDDKLGCW